MVYIPWEEQYGICKFHAMMRTTCSYADECRWEHPPERLVRRIWDEHSAVERCAQVSSHEPVSNQRYPDAHHARSTPDHLVGWDRPRAGPDDFEYRPQAHYFDTNALLPRKTTPCTEERARDMTVLYRDNQFPSNGEAFSATLIPARDPAQAIFAQFNPTLSRNPFVNGSILYRFKWGDPLCVRCGTTGHLPQQCPNYPLSDGERAYLHRLMKEGQAQSRLNVGRDATTSSLRPSFSDNMGSRPLTNSPDLRRPRLTWRVDEGLGHQDGPSEDVHKGSSNYWERREVAKRKAAACLLELGDRVTPGTYKRKAGSGCEYFPKMIDNPYDIRNAPNDIRWEREKGGLKTQEEEFMNPLEGDRTKKADAAEPSAADITQQQPDRNLLLKTPTPTVPVSSTRKAPVPKTKSRNMGATKRMSNGEAKLVGPHPSTIRVSAPYITQSAIEKRLATTGLDAQERSQAEAREDTARLQGVAWLDNVRRALQLPIRTFTTACVYYHKFRLANQEEKYMVAWQEPAAAALLTSCKNEDTLKKSRDILAAAYNLKLPTHEHTGADDPILEAQSRLVIGVERMVLEAGSFDFRSRSPHHVLVKISKSLPHCDDLKAVSQLAWIILTDLHRTFAPLKHTSSTLALASLELAAHFIAAKTEDNTSTARDELQTLDPRRWHTTREEVMETLLDALDLYTHHTAATILGSKYALNDVLNIRLQLNKECTDSSLPRYTTVQPPPSPDNANGTGSTLPVANGHPTPISPPQLGTQTPAQPAQTNGAASNQLTAAENGGTFRFMLDPERATHERGEVKRYYTEEWEEYEEEIEVPLPRSHDRDRDHHSDRSRDHDRSRDYPREPRERDNRRPRDLDDRGSARGSPRVGTSNRERERERERDRPRGQREHREREDADRDRTRDRPRDRERRDYDRRPYDRSERGGRGFEEWRERDRDYERRPRNYDEDRRREGR